MKKLYFLLMVFLVTVSGSLYAQKSLVDEGFESTSAGSLPAGWTLSTNNAAKKWAVEVDLGNNLFDPANCATGKGRVKFLPGTTGAAAQSVKLISPEVNTTFLAEPILIFDYASIRPTGSSVVDTLKVYYRLRGDRDWVLARAYGEADVWTRDTIDFSSKTATFQFAFECVDNGARGAAIDNVRLTSRPICREVSGVEVFNKIHSEAKLRWSGSISAKYNVVIGTRPLANPATATEADGLFLRQTVDYVTSMQINASVNKGLTSSTTYYYYIQSDCGDGDVSAWVSGQFITACDPVQNFSTSFDEDDALNCWTTIGEGHGTFIATAPNNVVTKVMESVDDEGNPFYMTPSNGMNPRTGTKALWMPVKSKNADDYSRVFAVSPRLADNVRLQDQQLTFWMRTNTKKIHLRLIISEWPDDFTNAQESGEIVSKFTDTYERFTISFEDITSNGKYIAFMIDGSEELLNMPQWPFVNIDDVVLEPIGACTSASKVVMFNDPVLTETTASLRWNRSAAARFVVKVANNDFNPANERGNVYNDTVSNPQVALTNLSVGTRYFYYVQPICTDGTIGTWSNTQMFQTNCSFDGVSIPFKENFDKITDPSVSDAPLPVCWNTIIPPASSEWYTPKISRSDVSYSKYFCVRSVCQGATYIILPKINAEVKDVQLRFFYYIESKAVPLEVGVMSDISDVNTYVKVDEFTQPELSSSGSRAWQEAVVRFDSYNGNGKYIVLYFNTASVSYYFDNFIVEDRADCATPSNIHSVEATASSIKMDWTASGDDENEWDIAYAMKNADFSSATIITGVTEHPYNITGLDENTPYDVYVRSVCSTEAKGAWEGPITVNTISPATLPYTCDFESESAAGAWSLLNGVQENQWIIGDAVKTELNNGTAVGKTLYISTDYGMTNYAVGKDTYGYATRLLNLNAGLIDFEFDWRLPGAGVVTDYYDYYDVYKPYQSTNGIIIPFLVPEEIVIDGGVPYSLYQIPSCIGNNAYRGIDWEKSTPEGWIRICDGIGYLASKTNDWQHYKYTYPLRESGRYNLVIVYITPGANVNVSLNAAAVDNVSVKENHTDCIAPVDLVAFDIAQYSAKVRFVNYNATEWKVVVADTIMTNAELETATAATEHVAFVSSPQSKPVSLANLLHETQYYAYIRPACGTQDTWSMVDFRTICPSVDVPLSYTFDEEEYTETYMGENSWGGQEEMKVKTIMDCWRRIPEKEDKSLTAYLSGSMAQTYKFRYEDIKSSNETQMFVISTGYSDKPTHLASPELTANVKDLMLSFRVVSADDYAKHPKELEVGIMTDPLDPTTFELVETIRPQYAGQWKTHYVFFDQYTGAGKHIAMRLASLPNYTTSLFIDDLKIDSLTGCIPARDISVSNVTGTTADVEWKVLGTPGDYHVKVTTTPLGRWEDKANVYDDTISVANQLQLTSLRPDKNYYIYVRTICTEEGGYSLGISDLMFRTACADEMVLPFYEDFDSYEINSMPVCWYVMQNAPDGGSHLTEFSNTTILGEYYKQLGRLSLMLQTGNQNLFPAMVAMPAVPGNIQEFALSLKALQMNSSDQLVVGVVSDVNDPKTFVSVDTINCSASYQWEDVYVNFNSYTGTGKHIAFFLPSSYFGSSFTIDNILIRSAAIDCADAAAPQVLNVTSTNATIRWADNPTVNSFEIKVASDEINPEIEEGDVLVTTPVNDLQYELGGLQPATVYYAYVRNMCSANAGGYWSKATQFLTSCATPEQIPYFEDFTTYGDISDQGFFPICWRSRVIAYGSISSDNQPDPYIENSTRPSLFMKAYFNGGDMSYAVVDAATPAIDFGAEGASGYMMTMSYKSSVKGAPIYVGLMSDPSDATTFVAYDTIRTNSEGKWESNIVNFVYHDGGERHIAFRINSLDIVPEDYDHEDYNQRTEGYQVNITDIKVEPLNDCMPPYRVHADIRPNRAFITWVPGDKTSEEWKYYVGESQMSEMPFTDEEWNYSQYSYNKSAVTGEHSYVVNGLKDWTDYYFYLKSTGCDAFYPQAINLSNRPSCGTIRYQSDLPIAPDFMNNGLGIGAEPEYSSYFDCWNREDDFGNDVDPVAYPYINDNAELYFKTNGEAQCYAYLPLITPSNDSIINNTQIRLTAKASANGAKMVIGYAYYYEEGWPAVKYWAFEGRDTITLTNDYEEYVVRFEDFDFNNLNTNPDMFYDRVGVAVTAMDADMLVNDINWELIPYCYTPELRVKRHDDTSFEIEWEKLNDQEKWEVAFGPQGFDLESAKWISRADTTYTVVNQTAGTPYEFYLRSLCGNGMTSEYGHICVTTDQVPAQYPYSSPLFYDATFISAYDGMSYAYRTINMPAGPHTLTFDWKLSDNSDAFLRVFSVPATEMITADAAFGITKTSAAPEGWIDVTTLSGKSAWTAASHTLYVSLNNASASHLLFVWTGADAEVVKNVNVTTSTDCTVPEALVATNITSTSVVLNWTSFNASAWDLNYWRTTEGRADLKTILDVTNGYKLTGLEPNTQYTFEVASQCNSKYSQPFTFRTACPAANGLYETFDLGKFDDCWSQYRGMFDEVVADASKLIPAENVWNVTDIPMLGTDRTKNARLTIEGEDCASWLVSPSIILNENSALSFYLAFTAYNGTNEVVSKGQVDDRFIVAVSTDEGQTWKTENATIWDNANNTNKILNRIGNIASRVYVDLTPYTGKTVRVAFYGESTVEFESNDIHVDSISIDCVNRKLEKDSYCSGYTYSRNGFEINREDLNVAGDHVFTRLEASKTSGCDTLIVLNLNVRQSKETEYDRSICSNDVYNDKNFANLSSAGTYTKQLTATNGCDSLIILNLIVNQSYEVTRTLEIDENELPFEYECQLFPVGTKSGMFEINCPTAANCDSIIHLTLTVNEITAVDNVENTETVVLTPNPVKGGELITVDYDFSFDQIAGISIEVYNSVGQMVSVSTPQGKPVAFSAPQTAGVYTVRIITADERVLIGRFIVR